MQDLWNAATLYPEFDDTLTLKYESVDLSGCDMDLNASFVDCETLKLTRLQQFILQAQVALHSFFACRDVQILTVSNTDEFREYHYLEFPTTKKIFRKSELFEIVCYNDTSSDLHRFADFDIEEEVYTPHGNMLIIPN